MTSYTLYVDNGYSYSALGFANYRDMGAWLREHGASVVAPSVWALDEGFAAQTEMALDLHMATLAGY